MPWWGYLIIAIAVIIGLVATFFITYHLNKITPVPKGCENLMGDEETCSACSNYECALRKEKVDDSAEKPADLNSNDKKVEKDTTKENE